MQWQETAHRDAAPALQPSVARNSHCQDAGTYRVGSQIGVRNGNLPIDLSLSQVSQVKAVLICHQICTPHTESWFTSRRDLVVHVDRPLQCLGQLR